MKTSQNIFALFVVIFILTIFTVFISFLIAYFCNKKFLTKWKIFFINFSLILLFPIALVFGEHFGENIASVLYCVGATLLGMNFLTFLILFPFFIIAKIRNKEFGKITKIIIAIFCISINIHSLYAGFVPEINNFKITTERKIFAKKKKIVLVSDMHYGYIHGKIEAKNLVKIINSLSPDMVLIPGDVFDGPKIDFEGIAKILEKISAPTFYVNGNHEEYRHTNEILSAISKTDIIILNDETREFDDFVISGVTYHKNKNSTELAKTLENIAPKNTKKAKILLKHEPTGHKIIEKFGYDLVVSGHTHRGQMWPFSLIPAQIYGKYVYGLQKDNSLFSFTTSGVGNWGPPQRFLTRSEIIVLEVE